MRWEIQEDLASKAMRDPSDPSLTAREQAALEMATLFTLDYRSITDDHVSRWRTVFSDAELIELATFMALADGFGKVVEMLGLGDVSPTGSGEI
ncbi:hypothetical protein HRbin22_00725 [Candidatus Thermoflexus japonica]|uniref:Carboxymuconolactone decarboxylase n=1 Tax=Candidatus Thermoflexus japonica TaxID=2035417 RepID=A0A2H5Y4W8_9CHLR|nr:hypothetical protein HRbin22_00725 [Candidatus Thermoflexus japonica]